MGVEGTALDLSLVVPLYNEEENVEPLVEACLAALPQVAGHFELILVDDGSQDGTAELLATLADQHSQVRALSLRRRFGKGAALAAGLARARGRRLATIDADLQEDPRELAVLLAGLGEGLDLVSGWRRVRHDAWNKRVSSWLFNFLVRCLTRLPIRDINCGFKVMTREVAEELVLTGGRFRFVPLLAEWLGFRIGEREITHQARARGRSRFGPERFPRAVIDLLAILSLVRYHSRPGHLLIQSGGLAGILGVGVCAWITWLFFKHGNIQSHHPLLALGVLLVIIGFQLVATGFLAEWLAYRHRDGDPGYRIRWQRGFLEEEPQRQTHSRWPEQAAKGKHE
ncbi:MAG: glycosyltransferase family 2 protein [Planctomycetota bacterium]